MAIIDPKVRQSLDQRGVDSVRALLDNMSNGAAGYLGDGISVSRANIEDRLREKETAAARWIKTGVIAAIVAAAFAFLAWRFPIR